MIDKVIKNFEIKKAPGKDQINTQLTVTFGKSTIGTLKKDVKGLKYIFPK